MEVTFKAGFNVTIYEYSDIFLLLQFSITLVNE